MEIHSCPKYVISLPVTWSWTEFRILAWFKSRLLNTSSSPVSKGCPSVMAEITVIFAYVKQYNLFEYYTSTSHTTRDLALVFAVWLACSQKQLSSFWVVFLPFAQFTWESDLSYIYLKKCMCVCVYICIHTVSELKKSLSVSWHHALAIQQNKCLEACDLKALWLVTFTIVKAVVICCALSHVLDVANTCPSQISFMNKMHRQAEQRHMYLWERAFIGWAEMEFLHWVSVMVTHVNKIHRKCV